LEVIRIEEDVASGKSRTGRPGLTAAITAVEAGDADALVVAKLDRLSRSLLDFATLIEQSRKKGWSLIALDIGLDTTTANGRMSTGIVAVLAEWERELIGQRTRDALAAKRLRTEAAGHDSREKDDGLLNGPIGRKRLLPRKVVRRIERMRRPESLTGRSVTR
jgi:DNA invertase Pin-like site-specific DNA recombinase